MGGLNLIFQQREIYQFSDTQPLKILIQYLWDRAPNSPYFLQAMWSWAHDLACVPLPVSV